MGRRGGERSLHKLSTTKNRLLDEENLWIKLRSKSSARFALESNRSTVSPAANDPQPIRKSLNAPLRYLNIQLSS